MKKSLIMVLALCVAAAMILSACGQAKKPEATTAPESVAEQVSEAVSEAAEEVKEEASEAVSEAAEEVKEESSEVVSEVTEEVTEAVSEAAEEVKEEASEVAEEITDAAEEVKEEAADAAEEVKEEASEVVEEVKEDATEVVEEVSEVTEEAQGEAEEVVEEVKEEAADTAEEVKEDVSEAVEEVKEEAAAVVEDVKDKAEEVKEEAAAVAEDAKDKAEEIVEDVTAEAKEAAEETVELTVPMTYAEYAAAEIDDEVFVEAYVQATQSWWEDAITVYAADEDGAYFIYNMACSEEDAAKLVPGTKILVKGYKAEWSGEVEIADATFEFAEEDGEGFIAEAEDVTELLGKDELIDHMNEFVSFKGLTVELSKDADEKEAPFLYNWDGSGTQGDDLYFNASINGETFTFTVESYLCDKDTDVYKAVEALKAGDVVDMEGFLYWYNGANPHITAVTVEEVKEEVPEAVEEVKEDASEVAEEAKEEVVEAVEEVKEDAAEAAEEASNILDEAKDKAAEVVEDVKDTAAGIIEGASEVIGDAKDKVVEAVDDVKDTAAGIVAGASDVVEDIKDKVVEAVETVKEDASEVAEEVKEEASEIAEEAVEAVEDVTAEAKEAAEETVELTAPMTYAEYAAAEIDDEVFVEAYVQATQSWWEDKITVYAADEDGAYFIYNMACSEEDAAKLVPGTKILVKGYKAEWSGEVEIADATFEFAEEDGEGFIAEAEDVTELLGKDELIDHMNEFVSFKGLTVELSKDADEKEAPFLYNWDGSGTQGDDLYFNASINGETFTFTVESYLCDKDTDVYKAVEALKAGDVVDMEGFLYWYNGANPHITSVTVVK